jgi:protein involved in polysaccharide export with SLBB domain
MNFWQKTLLVWLASTLTAMAQYNPPPSILSDYGANPSTPANAFQSQLPPPGLPPSMAANATSADGNTTEATSGNATTPGAAGAILQPALVAPVPANMTTTAPVPSTPTVGSMTPAAGNTSAASAASAAASEPAFIPSHGPDLSNVPMPNSMDLIDNLHKLQQGDQFVYQVLEDGDKPSLLFVDETGNVNIPYYGRFKAGGMTLRQAAFAVQKELENPANQLYKRATVLAVPFSGGSRGQVNVIGEVNRPGPLDVPTDHVLSLWEAILEAGGFTASADHEHLRLVHRDPTDPSNDSSKELNFTKMQSDGTVTSVILQPGDFIDVPSKTDTSGIIHVYGQVRAPQRMALPTGSNMTVSDAIIAAGGFTDFAVHTVTVVRYDKNNQRHELKEDVDDVTKKGDKNADIKLEPDDTIIVDSKYFSFGFQ